MNIKKTTINSFVPFFFMILFCQPSLADENYLAASITFSKVNTDGSVSVSTTSLPTSSGTSETGNNWTSKQLYTYSFGSCLTMSGSLSFYYSDGNGTSTVTMPASWITASSSNTNFATATRNGSSVKSIIFTSDTLKIVNSCSYGQTFKIYRTLDFGENHWNLTISNGTTTIPAKNFCTVSFPNGNTLDLGSISAADINQKYNSLLSNYAATTVIQASCTTATLNLLSFSSSNTIDSGGCLTDSATSHNLSFCLSANSTDLNFSSSSKPSITLTGSGQHDVSLTVTPRSLTNNATAGTYSSTVTVTLAPE